MYTGLVLWYTLVLVITCSVLYLIPSAIWLVIFVGFKICEKVSEFCYLIKNTPGVKKGRPRTKQALLKKIWNQMGSQCLLVLIGLKVLVMMNSLQNIVISGTQRPTDVDGIKIFDKDDQATKH